MSSTEVGTYLVIDEGVCHGQLTFRGTRIPVETVLTYLGKGYAVDQLLQSWPELTREAIEEALALASDSLRRRFQLDENTAAAVSA